MERVHSFQDLLDFYGEFLLGHVNEVPTHGGPLVSDHIQDRKPLFALNRHGILSVNGQAGVCSRNERQRAYLDLYVPWPSPQYSILYEKLIKTRNLLFIAILPNGQIYGNMYNTAIYFDIKKGFESTSPPKNDELRRDKDYGLALPLTASKMQNGKWKWVSNFWLEDYPAHAFQDWNTIQTAMSPGARWNMPQIAAIAIVHRRFCSTNLVQTLLRYLKHPNIQTTRK